ncbi:MAG: ABC transporter permease [Actinomycetota bacterium]
MARSGVPPPAAWPPGSVPLAAARPRPAALPIIRSSVLLGRTISTSVIGIPSLIVMIACGLLVGWRPDAGIAHAVAGFAMLSLFGFAMSWIGVLIGMVARSPQSADGLSMLPAFLLGFVSNVFVPLSGLPSWLRVFAEWNPVSAVVAAARQMFGTSQASQASSVWPLAHPVLMTLGMSVILLAVLLPLSVRRYTRSAR